MKTDEITRLAEFLTELAGATEGGREFRVEWLDARGRWLPKQIGAPECALFYPCSEYRIVYEDLLAREKLAAVASAVAAIELPSVSQAAGQAANEIWDILAEAESRIRAVAELAGEAPDA